MKIAYYGGNQSIRNNISKLEKPCSSPKAGIRFFKELGEGFLVICSSHSMCISSMGRGNEGSSLQLPLYILRTPLNQGQIVSNYWS